MTPTDLREADPASSERRGRLPAASTTPSRAGRPGQLGGVPEGAGGGTGPDGATGGDTSGDDGDGGSATQRREQRAARRHRRWVRACVGQGLVGAAACAVTMLSLSSLVAEGSWVSQSLLMVLAVAGAGMALRAVTRSDLLVAVGQLLVWAWLGLGVAGALTGAGSLVPDGRSLVVLADRLGEFADIVRQSAAPVPAAPGVLFVVVFGVGMLAVLVDLLGVTLRSPAAAGIPLLTLFLVGAANGSSQVPWFSFAGGAALWLVLLARGEGRLLRDWATAVTSPDTQTQVVDEGAATRSAFAGLARGFGGLAIGAALLLSLLMPHLPTRYVLDGLARGGQGGPSATIGFSSTLDLSRSLTQTGGAPVLTYTTDAQVPAPFRVAVATDYAGGTWRVGVQRGPAGQLMPESLVGPTSVQTTQVSGATLSAPHVASEGPVQTFTPADATTWGASATGDIVTTSELPAYSFTYLQPQWTEAQLAALTAPSPTTRDFARYLTVDQTSRSAVQAAVAAAGADTGTPFARGVAIQSWLRDTGGFSYSLTIPDPGADPLGSFLSTKTGYCVQFSSAMVMMARSQGIPAREVIGFLPGTVQDGRNVIYPSDAHAWPELYITGAGWVRFEPTPGSRTGSAPVWTVPVSDAPGSTGGGGRSVDDAPTPSAAAADPTPTRADPASEADTSTWTVVLDGACGWFGEPGHAWAVGLLALIAGLGIVGSLLPRTAARLRRERLVSGVGGSPTDHPDVVREHAEQVWRALTGRLSDLGVRLPASATPRELPGVLPREVVLPAEATQAFARVTQALEVSRYARGLPAASMATDADEVARQVGRTRSWRTRARAYLWPSDALTFWSQRFLGARDRLGATLPRPSRIVGAGQRGGKSQSR